MEVDQLPTNDLNNQASSVPEFPHWTDRLYGIFFRPVDTLRYVFANPSFKLPHVFFLFLIVASLLFGYATADLSGTGMSMGPDAFTVTLLGIWQYISWLIYGSVAYTLIQKYHSPVTFKGTLSAYAHALIPLMSVYLLILMFSGGFYAYSNIVPVNTSYAVPIITRILSSKFKWLITLIWTFFLFKAAGLSNLKAIIFVLIMLVFKFGIYLVLGFGLFVLLSIAFGWS